MKIALTGITGFVGQNLMPLLAREYPDIEILTMNIDAAEAARLYPDRNIRNAGISAPRSWGS